MKQEMLETLDEPPTESNPSTSLFNSFVHKMASLQSNVRDRLSETEQKVIAPQLQECLSALQALQVISNQREASRESLEQQKAELEFEHDLLSQPQNYEAERILRAFKSNEFKGDDTNVNDDCSEREDSDIQIEEEELGDCLNSGHGTKRPIGLAKDDQKRKIKKDEADDSDEEFHPHKRSTSTKEKKPKKAPMRQVRPEIIPIQEHHVPTLPKIQDMLQGDPQPQAPPKIQIPASPPLQPVSISAPHLSPISPDPKYDAYMTSPPSSSSSKGKGFPPMPRTRKLPPPITAILRGWTFNNLSHPYPSEEAKNNLCNETGLTMIQINNWFTNARRRLIPKWKSEGLLDKPERAIGRYMNFVPSPPQYHAQHMAPSNADNSQPMPIPMTIPMVMPMTPSVTKMEQPDILPPMAKMENPRHIPKIEPHPDAIVIESIKSGPIDPMLMVSRSMQLPPIPSGLPFNVMPPLPSNPSQFPIMLSPSRESSNFMSHVPQPMPHLPRVPPTIPTDAPGLRTIPSMPANRSNASTDLGGILKAALRTSSDGIKRMNSVPSTNGATMLSPTRAESIS
eukprot:TRINITY_DN3336_c0_g1_i2.p1 TRINITY_DN3336_c0_g1~~TRINITY_DN3336_c0_g1_i2.p1  ORF type:complete len:567 (-),score=132.49 TRINITY_DN3336_c0_g1_i2:68-1768(-)